MHNARKKHCTSTVPQWSRTGYRQALWWQKIHVTRRATKSVRQRDYLHSYDITVCFWGNIIRR